MERKMMAGIFRQSRDVRLPKGWEERKREITNGINKCITWELGNVQLGLVSHGETARG